MVPYFGGQVGVDGRGLVRVNMPPRRPITAFEGCLLHGEVDACDLSHFYLPEAYGTYGEDVILALMGWQLDTRHFDAVMPGIIKQINAEALRRHGKTATLLDRLKDAADAASIMIPMIVLAVETGGAALALLEFYLPDEFIRSATVAEIATARETLIEDEFQLQGALADQASEMFGIPRGEILGDFNPAPDRGWWWKLRTFSPAAAEAQRRDGGVVLEITPGRYLCREYSLYEGGPFVDHYDPAGALIYEEKGYHGFMVKNGRINPSFREKESFQKIVAQLDRQVHGARLYDDYIVWTFEKGDPFKGAFEVYLQEERPELWMYVGTGKGQFVVFTAK